MCRAHAAYPPAATPAISVLAEVCYLLEREKGTRAESAFLRSVGTGQISLIPLARVDIDRVVELIEKYADFPLGAVDASVVAVAERLEADAIAILDWRHFSVVRSKNPFTLVP